VLDAVSAPAAGKRAHPLLNSVNSEFSETQAVEIACTTDSYDGSVTAGSEQFSVFGEAGGKGGILYDPVGGSGRGPGLRTINEDTKLLNGTMEAFTSNVPTNWTLANGTALTHISQETTQKYRGASSVEFSGTGAQATIRITQAIASSNLVPGKRYILGLRYKASAIDTASQTFLVLFTGTGYTASSSEKISILGNVWSTSWSHQYFYVNLPRNLPTDWKCEISITGTMSAGKMLWVDDVAFAPVTWFAGVNLAGFAGATPAAIADRWTFTLSNDEGGLFSRLLTRHFGVQLPSNNAGAETILDSLAE
jgi:hypothetical protein